MRRNCTKVFAMFLTLCLAVSLFCSLGVEDVSAAVKKPGRPVVTLTAGKKTGQLKVTIKKNADTAGYKIYLSEDGSRYSLVKDLKKNGKLQRTFTITKLKSGKTYWVKVKAYRMNGTKAVNSSYSKVKKLKLASGKSSVADTIDLELWTLGDGGQNLIYVNAIEELKKTFPNVNVEVVYFENEDYKVKIKEAAENNKLPDLFYTWSCGFLGDFVASGKVYGLDENYRNYTEQLSEKMLINTTYDGKLYGVPLVMNAVGLFVNMDVLKSAGYDSVPKTYKELMSCCDDLVSLGITPFGLAGAEDWCITEYLEPIIEKSCGAKELNAVFTGKKSWDNQEIASAVDAFQNMIKKGYFGDDFLFRGNDEVAYDFMSDKYAFYMNGTWNCSMFAAEQKIKLAEFPAINKKKSSNGQMIGGPSDAIAVSAASANADIAAKYVFELGKLLSKSMYLDGSGISTWNDDVDVKEVNRLTKATTKQVEAADMLVLFGDTVMNSNDAGIYLSYVRKVAEGSIDGKGFIEGLAMDIR